MQTTKRNYTKVARTALVLSVALMVLATMAAPAFADDDLVIVEMILTAEAVEYEPVEDGPFDGFGPAYENPLYVPFPGGVLQEVVELDVVGDDDDLTVIPDGGAFEMVPHDEQPPIGDGGDWEMAPGDDGPTIPDDGDFEMVPSDDETETPDVPDNQETPGDDGDQNEPGDEPSDEPSETPVPETPDADNEDSLPFTGGNGTPYGIAGIAIALAGAGYLLRKRYVFARD